MRRAVLRAASVHRDRWMVSYADFVTLLFALFVVLFASARSGSATQEGMAESIQSAFAHRVPAVAQGEPSTRAFDPLQAKLAELLGPELQRGEVGLARTGEGLVISLQEAGFFQSGTADVRRDALAVLAKIAEALPDSGLRIEGHTDNVPIQNAQFASNWELSSARASSVARLLLQQVRLRGDGVSVSGYAEFHPVADNATAEGRARNRRVDIVVVR